MIPRKPIFSINEAAEILGCSRYYIRQFVDQGLLRPMRVQAELLGDLSQHPQSEREDNPSFVEGGGPAIGGEVHSDVAAYLDEDQEPSQ